MRDELLQVSRPDSPAFVEAYGREARELVAWEAQDLEVRPPAVQCDTLLAGSCHLHRRRRELACDLAELLRRDRDGARRFDVGSDFGADRDVQISSRET